MEYAVFSRRRFTGSLRGLPYHARLGWDIVLYEAEKLRGKVHLPPIDFATMAGITVLEARDALELYQQPDPDSATVDQDGRRLVPVAGEPHWYNVVAWEEHQKERKAFFNRLRQQRWYAKTNGSAEDDLTQPNADCSNLTKEPELEPEVKTGSNLSSPKKEDQGSKTFSARERAKKQKSGNGHGGKGDEGISERQFAFIASQVRPWDLNYRELNAGGSADAYAAAFNRQNFGVTWKRFQQLREKYSDSS